VRTTHLLPPLPPGPVFLQPDGAGGLEGLASLVEFTGATTPPLGHAPIRAATKVSWVSSTWLSVSAGAGGSGPTVPACLLATPAAAQPAELLHFALCPPASTSNAATSVRLLILCVQARSKASFNGGKSLLGNYFTIQAVPTAGGWDEGLTACW
jgi:hypothetical protein